VALIYSCPVLASEERVPPERSDVLGALDRNHPRLMLKDAELKKLKHQYAADEVLQGCVGYVLNNADSYSRRSVLTYDKIGPRLLHVSRECLRRIYTLGLAWRWTGREKYAQKATENLLAVCGFADWNPSHFLDTAEMSHAVGVGYDWLYYYFDAQTRECIRNGLIKNGLEPGLRAYDEQWWPASEYNWNQVCNGGMIIGALAVAESDPVYAEKVIPAAVKSLPLALKSYDPDGAWLEGPSYWHYATSYTAFALTALNTALGKDFGLSNDHGLSKAGLFPIYMTGPAGLFLNFADSKERNSRKPMPCMFCLAHTYNNSLFADAEHPVLAMYGADPEHIIWYKPASPAKPYPDRLDRYFRGPVEVAVFRSAWNNPDALFVGIKAGFNQVNHGHLDLGNFEMDALGVRWARDLGSDNYNLPGYWEKKKGGKRWSYYRLNSASHNVPTINRTSQDELAEAKFVKFKSEESAAFVIVDLSEAYKQFARKVSRGIAMVENRRAVLVQDEFELKMPSEVIWGMTTDAEVTIKKGRIAELSLSGKKLEAQLLCPSGAEFATESAERKLPEKPNAGAKRLLVRLPQAEGSVTVAVLLSPIRQQGFVKHVEIKPLTQW
jgi:hypothetical protein